nr:RNA-directed DNA polymerase, eukaryota, nucleotide-binding alpha-beta plait domain protein [Tanacetum cinerariifolium]
SKSDVARGISCHSFAEVVKKPIKVADAVRRKKNDLPHGDSGLQKGDSYSPDNAHKYNEQKAKVKDAATIKFLSGDIVSESKFGCKVSVMGGSLVLPRFNNRDSSEHFLKSYLDTMEPWFHFIRRWDDETIDDERITRISVVRVPVKAFSIDLEKTVPIETFKTQERYFEDGSQNDNENSKEENMALTCLESYEARSRAPLASTEDDVTTPKNMIIISSDFVSLKILSRTMEVAFCLRRLRFEEPYVLPQKCCGLILRFAIEDLAFC